jgi:plasmid stabilization system protein ParE
MTRRTWTVRLSNTAEVDYDDILRWTEGRFGAVQAASNIECRGII